jgi:hypothetical protein
VYADFPLTEADAFCDVSAVIRRVSGTRRYLRSQVEFEVDGIADVLFRKCRVELTGSDPRAAATTTTQIRDAVLNWEPYTGYNLARLLRAMGIVLRGTGSGLATTTATYTAPAGGATVTATVDADGNRSVVSDTASGTP